MIVDETVKDNVLPWKEGFVPFWHRVLDGGVSRWTKAKVCSIRRADGEHFDLIDQDGKVFSGTEVDVPVGFKSMLRLLARPGEYVVSQIGKGEIKFEQAIVVENPLDKIYQIDFKDGLPLWRRPGRWDSYILSESMYKLLPIDSGDVVFDCGAHIGTFARMAASKGASLVYSYEPEPFNFSILKKNADISGKIIPIHAAVSNEAGDIDLTVNYVGEGGGNALHTIVKRYDHRPTVKVECRNLFDEIRLRRPKRLKLDIEGTENILRYEEIDQCVKSMVLEIDGGMKGHELCAKIIAAGFKFQFEPKWGARNALAYFERPEGNLP